MAPNELCDDNTIPPEQRLEEAAHAQPRRPAATEGTRGRRGRAQAGAERPPYASRTRHAMLLKPHCGAFGVPFMKMSTRFAFTSRAMKSLADSVLPPLNCCRGRGRREAQFS